MADTKGPTLMIGHNKLAMSKALGAAFLSHQVEQLEKSTNAGGGGWRRDGGRGGRGPAPRVPSGSPPKAAKGGQGQSQNKRRSNEGAQTDADIIVVDASVLVHCLNQVKAWCRDGREETIIVPLEALNTLDLLKKGTTSLAQRARNASRILESQVGTNPRIQVQSDAAFVRWDALAFDPASAAEPPVDAPEWLRRTVCCARFETDAAARAGKRIVLAVAAAPAPAPRTPASPVPLPAPTPTASSKYEPRATGTLVRAWAARAGLPLLQVKPTPEDAGGNERSSGPPNRSPGRARRAEPARGPPGGGGEPLVERPPAVQTMMNIVGKPSGGIRLLARGEKLEP